MHNILRHQIGIQKFNFEIEHFDLRITMLVSECIVVNIYTELTGLRSEGVK